MRSPHPIREAHLALLPLIIDSADRKLIDPAILGALIEHETEGEPEPTHATRDEPGWRWFWPPNYPIHPDEKFAQARSYGAGQVMGSNLREMGWGRPLDDILEYPADQVEYAARYLRRMWAGASTTPERPREWVACARYNAGGKGEETHDGREYADGVLAGVPRWREAIAALEVAPD